jgi:cyclase
MLRTSLLTVLCLHSLTGAAQETSAAPARAAVASVEILVQDLGHGVYLLGNGGPNALAAVAGDGVILVDAKVASVTDKLKAAVAGFTPKAIRFVITSHNHSANNGGNQKLAEAGAIIIGHENARRRMAEGSRMERTTIAPFPAGALPTLTFTESITVALDGQTAVAKYVRNAHTDSDIVVLFREANVLFVSDLYRPGEYPLIGVTENGSVDGMISAIDTILSMSDAQTKIIGAYGSAVGRAELTAYRSMLVAVRDRVAKLKKAGSGEDQVVAAHPLGSDYTLPGQDAARADSFLRNVYRSLPK